MLLLLRDRIIAQLLYFILREEDNRVLGCFKLRLETLVIHQGVISLVRRPIQEPFEKVEFLSDGGIVSILPR